MKVGAKQVRRVCKRIGAERCEERDKAVARYRALPLATRKGVPKNTTAPKLAVVGVDGGRLQIFERSATESKSAAPQPSRTDEAADDDLVEREYNGKHWREDKIGLLMTMTSSVHASDPCPEIPGNFVNPLQILKLARELKKCVPSEEEAVKPAADIEAEQQVFTPMRREWEPPEVESKRLVASRRSWELFGPMVATRAWECGFYGATRRAFLGDGASSNWTLWRNHFSSFTPILDFIHALTSTSITFPVFVLPRTS